MYKINIVLLKDGNGGQIDFEYVLWIPMVGLLVLVADECAIIFVFLQKFQLPTTCWHSTCGL